MLAHLLRPADVGIRIGYPREAGARIAHAWVELGGKPLEDVSRFQVFETPAGFD